MVAGNFYGLNITFTERDKDEESLKFLSFLRERDIGPQVVDNITKEKIDIKMLAIMSDEDMQAIGINKFGDRSAIKVYCQRLSGPGLDNMPKTDEVLGRPCQKMSESQLKRKRGATTGKVSLSKGMLGNTNAKKNSRKVKIGWMHDDQRVRKANGGGTRERTVNLDMAVSELLLIAKSYFFPFGNCILGDEEDFSFEISSFDGVSLTPEITVDEVINKTGEKFPRIYLKTSYKNKKNESDRRKIDDERLLDDEVLPDFGDVLHRKCQTVQCSTQTNRVKPKHRRLANESFLEGSSTAKFEYTKATKTNSPELAEPEDDPLARLKGKMVSCRICKGDHRTAKCPYKDSLAPIQESADSKKQDEAPVQSAAPGGVAASRPGKYVIPSRREGGNKKGESMNSREEPASIRVRNLSKDTKQNDLRDLFRPFGSIFGIYLIKDKVSRQPKGFAYIKFNRREDAARAIAGVSGVSCNVGCNRLILNVDWAKPNPS